MGEMFADDAIMAFPLKWLKRDLQSPLKIGTPGPGVAHVEHSRFNSQVRKNATIS